MPPQRVRGAEMRMASRLYKWIAEGARTTEMKRISQYSATDDPRDRVGDMVVFPKAYWSNLQWH
ncbi:MAG: hypothetical protein IJ955_03425 [Oscillospiraceae bacterium]|nr:hypothetical protein [Oscillospiraceae bacterium]